MRRIRRLLLSLCLSILISNSLAFSQAGPPISLPVPPSDPAILGPQLLHSLDELCQAIRTGTADPSLGITNSTIKNDVLKARVVISQAWDGTFHINKPNSNAIGPLEAHLSQNFGYGTVVPRDASLNLPTDVQMRSELWARGISPDCSETAARLHECQTRTPIPVTRAGQVILPSEPTVAQVFKPGTSAGFGPNTAAQTLSLPSGATGSFGAKPACPNCANTLLYVDGIEALAEICRSPYRPNFHVVDQIPPGAYVAPPRPGIPPSINPQSGFISLELIVGGTQLTVMVAVPMAVFGGTTCVVQSGLQELGMDPLPARIYGDAAGFITSSYAASAISTYTAAPFTAAQCMSSTFAPFLCAEAGILAMDPANQYFRSIGMSDNAALWASGGLGVGITGVGAYGLVALGVISGPVGLLTVGLVGLYAVVRKCW